jgi:hypothetical protein
MFDARSVFGGRMAPSCGRVKLSGSAGAEARRTRKLNAPDLARFLMLMKLVMAARKSAAESVTKT